MTKATLHRMYVGGTWGSGHPDAHGPIPHFEDIVTRVVAQYLQDGTVLMGTGVWEGKTEPCAVIETIIPEGHDISMQLVQWGKVARHLKDELSQDAVLLTETRIGHKFV